MSFKNFNFKSEQLEVDYISFKFQYLDDLSQNEIVKYLFRIGFNSYQESGKLANPVKESIQINSKNKYQVLFVKEGPYWEGTTLHFSGVNAAIFYSLVQKKLIDWKIFSSGVLSRFDLYHSRTNLPSDKLSTREFLQNCSIEFNERARNVSLEKNSRGMILKIGNRRSNNYSRIYETKNDLRFEHEMKGKFLQKYHLLLVESRLDEFEQKLSLHFLVSFGKLVPLTYSYMDWLVLKLRPLRKYAFPQAGLKTDYIKSEIKLDASDFMTLLQFLQFAQNLDYKLVSATDGDIEVTYRSVVFRARDFLKFQDPTIKSTNKYRAKQLRDFFESLQTRVYVKQFSDKKFQSLVMIPQATVDYLSLNIQGWVDPEPMAKYFFKAFGFNSTIVKRINGKWKPQVLKYDSRNQFQVSFRQYEYDPESKSYRYSLTN